MIEYLYNCIRATAGDEVTISAKITNDYAEIITEDCELLIEDENNEIISVDGYYYDGMWYFTVPQIATENLCGRYWYTMRHNNNSLCFKQPIYFI